MIAINNREYLQNHILFLLTVHREQNMSVISDQIWLPILSQLHGF